MHSQYTGTASVCLQVMVLNVNCPPTAGAGDVVAAALQKLKYLRKVTVWYMNPVPVLQTVGLCRKLQEVSVRYPKHCEVGMRCAYRWMYVDVCSHSVPDFTVMWIRLCDNSKLYHSFDVCVVYCLGSWNWSSDLWDAWVCVVLSQ